MDSRSIVDSNKNSPKKVLHICNNLYRGGAETMLYNLSEELSLAGVNVVIIPLGSVGTFGEKFIALSIPVIPLNLNGNLISAFFGFIRLIKTIKRIQPDVVQTWMFQADLLGGLAAKIAGVKQVIWNIRRSYCLRDLKVRTKLIIKINRYLSYLIPNKVICCSSAAILEYQAKGYCKKKFIFIPNAVDTVKFQHCSSSCFRSQLSLSNDILLVGALGRYAPEKDYDNFLKAAKLVSETNKFVKFVIVGRDVPNDKMKNLVVDLGLKNVVFLFPETNDVVDYLSALDIFVLSSKTEGFPNVVCEAMACEVPCVVTDVGDASNIIGNEGILVPPNNSVKLSQGINQILAMDKISRLKMGSMGRKRIEEHFEMREIANQYKLVYQ